MISLRPCWCQFLKLCRYNPANINGTCPEIDEMIMHKMFMLIPTAESFKGYNFVSSEKFFHDPYFKLLQLFLSCVQCVTNIVFPQCLA